jgi:hypothetical protein
VYFFIGLEAKPSLGQYLQTSVDLIDLQKAQGKFLDLKLSLSSSN